MKLSRHAGVGWRVQHGHVHVRGGGYVAGAADHTQLPLLPGVPPFQARDWPDLSRSCPKRTAQPGQPRGPR